MNLQHELRLRTANSSLGQLALMMGYSPRQAAKAGNRIHRVITSENLGLDSGHYDFKYSDAEFVSKLCKVLGMDAAECTGQIEKLSGELFEWKMAYKPWLYVDTGFQRTSQPIHVLGALEIHRRIPLPKLARLPLHRQVEQVKQVIVRHFQECSGFLPVWGGIQTYVLHYSPDSTVVFDAGGNILEAGEDSYQPPAKLTHKGQDITKIILE